jgi:transketolase
MSRGDFHLADYINNELELKATRKGFGEGLKKAGQADENVVALCADLTESTQMHIFKEAFPERFFEVGIAEQNLATVGAGLALTGKIPFISSYAAFSPGRNWEQIRTTAALNELPVKVIGSHAGLYTGADGATHQMLEDIALMRVMPNMVVMAPGDAIEAEKMTMAMAQNKQPNYLRLSREATPIFTTEKTPFEIGKAYVFEPGHEVTIISTGTMTYQSLLAAQMLFKDGIDAEVVHVPTIKPLDAVTILESLKKTKCAVTVEEAQINGGLGGAVAELVAENFPVPIKRVGVKDLFGQSGKPDQLFEHYGLTPKHIAMAVHQVILQAGKGH